MAGIDPNRPTASYDPWERRRYAQAQQRLKLKSGGKIE